MAEEKPYHVFENKHLKEKVMKYIKDFDEVYEGEFINKTVNEVMAYWYNEAYKKARYDASNVRPGGILYDRDKVLIIFNQIYLGKSDEAARFIAEVLVPNLRYVFKM